MDYSVNQTASCEAVAKKKCPSGKRIRLTDSGEIDFGFEEASRVFDALSDMRKHVAFECEKLATKQREFDIRFKKEGVSLKSLMKKDDSCICDSDDIDDVKDDCIYCNMNDSVMCSLQDPCNVQECGSYYLTSDYNASFVQICSKTGKKITLYWCSIVNFVWLAAFLLRTQEPLPSGEDFNGSEVCIPLFRGIKLRYSLVSDFVELFDDISGTRFFIDDFCDFEKIFQYCQSFPFKKNEYRGYCDPFVPCWFATGGLCTNCRRYID